MSISNFLENAILDKVFGNIDFTVSTPFVSLHTADPGETGTGELAAGTSGYARQAATFAAATNGTATNQAVITFTNLPDGTIVGAGVWDGTDTSANFLWGGTLVATKIVNSGDNLQFNIGSFVVTLD